MAYKGELLPAIEVEPGETVEFILGETPHAGYDALSSTDRGYMATLDSGAYGGEAAVLPAGTALTPASGYRTTWQGTVAEDADGNKEYYLVPSQIVRGALNNYWRIPIVVPVEDEVIDVPAGPEWEADNLLYELPAIEHVDWSRDGIAAQPGLYRAENDETVTVTATAQQGYVFPGGDTEVHYTFTFPPAGDGWPTEITDGGRQVAKWLRWKSEDKLQRATYYYAVVEAFVRGYTRGRGFTDDGPKYDLQVVIVSAAARLGYNPENLTRYQVDNYSETRTVFQGWNLAELAVLNNYRKRTA